MKDRLSLFAALCAFFVLVTASDQVIDSSRYGLRLCAELIVPSLFPFFVASGLLRRLGLPELLGRPLAPLAAKLFSVSGEGATALLMGLTGGYPMGAAYAAELTEEGRISASEGERLLAFCNNSGPAFILGAVGMGVFGSAAAGLLLYAVHILAAVCCGLLLARRGKAPIQSVEKRAAPGLSFSRALTESVRQAVVSTLSVCGFVVCFTAFAGLLDTGGFLSALSALLQSLTGRPLPWCRALLSGLLELGGGVGAMRGLPATPENLALAAGLLGWGGVSVQFQTLAVIADSELKGALHFAGRLVSALLGALFAYAFALLFL